MGIDHTVMTEIEEGGGHRRVRGHRGVHRRADADVFLGHARQAGVLHRDGGGSGHPAARRGALQTGDEVVPREEPAAHHPGVQAAKAVVLVTHDMSWVTGVLHARDPHREGPHRGGGLARRRGQGSTRSDPPSGERQHRRPGCSRPPSRCPPKARRSGPPTAARAAPFADRATRGRSRGRRRARPASPGPAGPHPRPWRRSSPARRWAGSR